MICLYNIKLDCYYVEKSKNHSLVTGKNGDEGRLLPKSSAENFLPP